LFLEGYYEYIFSLYEVYFIHYPQEDLEWSGREEGGGRRGRDSKKYSTDTQG
jgi:hypothetical protein